MSVVCVNHSKCTEAQKLMLSVANVATCTTDCIVDVALYKDRVVGVFIIDDMQTDTVTFMSDDDLKSRCNVNKDMIQDPPDAYTVAMSVF